MQISFKTSIRLDVTVKGNNPRPETGDTWECPGEPANVDDLSVECNGQDITDLLTASELAQLEADLLEEAQIEFKSREADYWAGVAEDRLYNPEESL